MLCTVSLLPSRSWLFNAACIDQGCAPTNYYAVGWCFQKIVINYRPPVLLYWTCIWQVEAVTRGVRVRASSIYAPEVLPVMDDSGLWHDMFAYRYGLLASARCCWCGGPHIRLLDDQIAQECELWSGTLGRHFGAVLRRRQ